MPGAYLWGWDATPGAERWRKVLVNDEGKLIIDPSEIFENIPTDDEHGKGPDSDWAYEHERKPTVHQNAPALIQAHAELPTAHQNAPALIQAHAELPTAHQNAPALIQAHAELPTAHQNAPALIQTHAELPFAHHEKTVRYTDVEAVAAAKTVKLDDFTAPDDNTDLDFSTAKHGLVPKGTNVGDFLKDDGTWAAVAAGKSIATGSFVGNGVANRQITTGFKCSFVVCFCVTVIQRVTLIPSMTIKDAANAHNTDKTTNIYLHATDGFFIVDTSGGFNTDTWVHYYWAISE